METNKQKAEEIAKKLSYPNIDSFGDGDDEFDTRFYHASKDAALEAMEWKDEQLKEYLIKRVESLDDDDFVAKQIIGGIYKDLFENNK